MHSSAGSEFGRYDTVNPMSDPADEQELRDLAQLHDEAGVDLTQIDLMLALTPGERLAALFVTASSLARLMPDDSAD
jgi:hypothetical protein